MLWINCNLINLTSMAGINHAIPIIFLKSTPNFPLSCHQRYTPKMLPALARTIINSSQVGPARKCCGVKCSCSARIFPQVVQPCLYLFVQSIDRSVNQRIKRYLQATSLSHTLSQEIPFHFLLSPGFLCHFPCHVKHIRLILPLLFWRKSGDE